MFLAAATDHQVSVDVSDAEGGVVITPGGVVITHGGVVITHGGVVITHGGVVITHGGVVWGDICWWKDTT